MKRILSGLILVILMAFCTISVFAEPSPEPSNLPVKSGAVVLNVGPDQDPIDRIKGEMTSKETGDIAFNIMGPVLKVGGVIFIILGIILTVCSVGYLAICFIKAIFGKGKVGKSHLGLAGAALFVGILLIGGAVFGILKFGKKVTVDPVNNQIIDPGAGIVSSAAPSPVPSSKQE